MGISSTLLVEEMGQGGLCYDIFLENCKMVEVADPVPAQSRADPEAVRV